jgi:hypothetical protein
MTALVDAECRMPNTERQASNASYVRSRFSST